MGNLEYFILRPYYASQQAPPTGASTRWWRDTGDRVIWTARWRRSAAWAPAARPVAGHTDPPSGPCGRNVTETHNEYQHFTSNISTFHYIAAHSTKSQNITLDISSIKVHSLKHQHNPSNIINNINNYNNNNNINNNSSIYHILAPYTKYQHFPLNISTFPLHISTFHQVSAHYTRYQLNISTFP